LRSQSESETQTETDSRRRGQAEISFPSIIINYAILIMVIMLVSIF